jgi:hypothetical protein
LTSFWQATQGVALHYDEITAVINKLHGFMSRLQGYKRYKVPEPLQKVIVQILICTIKTLGEATKRIKEGRFGELVLIISHITELEWQFYL